MSEVFREVLNRGVPIATPVTILSADLIFNSNNPEKTKEVINEQFQIFQSKLRDLGYLDFDLFMTMKIRSNTKTLEKRICFDYYTVYKSILFFINNNKDEDLFLSLDEVVKRLEKLRNIKHENKLVKSFPNLVRLYDKKLELVNKINDYFKHLDQTNMSKEMRLNRIEKLCEALSIPKSKLQSYRYYNVKKFCEENAESMLRLIENIEEVEKLANSIPLNLDEVDIDKDKLELVVASAFLSILKSEKLTQKQRYIYYLQDYFDRNKDLKDSDSPVIFKGRVANERMDIFKEGEKYTPKRIYQEYRKILMDNPDIELISFKNVDFSNMNLKEVEDYVQENLKVMKANWRLIPEGEMDKIILTSAENSISNVSDEEKEILRQRMIEIFMNKKEFYSQFEPYSRIQGVDTFDGYIGFIYPNGKVVLDKFFANARSSRLAYGEAIYILDIEDFYRLSQYSKQDLMGDDRVIRIVHNGNWEERVKDYIMGDTNTKTDEEVKKLIRRGKIKGE